MSRVLKILAKEFDLCGVKCAHHNWIEFNEFSVVPSEQHLLLLHAYLLLYFFLIHIFYFVRLFKIVDIFQMCGVVLCCVPAAIHTHTHSPDQIDLHVCFGRIRWPHNIKLFIIYLFSFHSYSPCNKHAHSNMYNVHICAIFFVGIRLLIGPGMWKLNENKIHIYLWYYCTHHIRAIKIKMKTELLFAVTVSLSVHLHWNQRKKNWIQLKYHE